MEISPLKSTKSGEYTICGQGVETYYYLNKGGNKKNIKFTPYKSRIVETGRYEGEYHPMCKIKDLPGINITENEIYDGNIVLYNAKHGNKKIPPHLLVSLIVCQYHSLIGRVRYDYDKMGMKLDLAHKKAALYTIGVIQKNLELLKTKDKKLYNCVTNDLEKTFGGNLEDIAEMYTSVIPRKKPKRKLQI